MDYDDSEKVPEEAIAAEMAEDDYIPNSDPNVIEFEQKKKKATILDDTVPKEQIKGKKKKTPQRKHKITEVEEITEKFEPSQPSQEEIEQRFYQGVQDVDQQTQEENEQQKGVEEQQEGVEEQQELDPQLVMANEVMVNDINDMHDMNVRFEAQFLQLFPHIGQPIDRQEPGFPQFQQFLAEHPMPKVVDVPELPEWIPELPDNLPEIDGKQPVLPPLPLWERFGKRVNRLPPLLDPRNLRRGFDTWDQPKQQEFLRTLRAEFPELVALFPPQPKQIPPNLQDEDGDELPLAGIPQANLPQANLPQAGQPQPRLPQPRLPQPGLPQAGLPQIRLPQPNPPLPEPLLETQSPLEDMETEDSFELLNVNYTPVMTMTENQEQVERQTIQEEMSELEERLREEEKHRNDNKKDIMSLLNRGLSKHNENTELVNIKKLMKGKELPKVEERLGAVLPSYGSAHINDLNEDELKMLFKKFTFQGQLVLSMVCPKWKQVLNSDFKTQTFVWFCNERENLRRFLPIEVCCESCQYTMDSEPVIRVIGDYLFKVIEGFLYQTPNLKCVRFYRFSLNKQLIAKKLREFCPHLQHLDLTECKDLLLPVIRALAQSFPNLKHLIMSSTNLNEKMLNELTKYMETLETLIVCSTYITGKSLVQLSSSLKRLDIRYCPKLSVANILAFFRSNKYRNLQHLKMDSLKNIEIYNELTKYNSLILLELNQSNEHIVREQSYLKKISSITNLVSLKITENVILMPTVFVNMTQSLNRMRSLCYEFNSYEQYMKETDLLTITTNWTLLERLEIIGCLIIEKVFIESLQRLLNLHYLNLTECSQIKDEDVSVLLKKLTKLSYVVVDKCHYLGKQTLDAGIIKATRMTHEIFRLSLLRSNLRNLPYIKCKLLPTNLRLTFSSIYSKRYCTFDGQRTKYGNFADISDYLKGL